MRNNSQTTPIPQVKRRATKASVLCFRLCHLQNLNGKRSGMTVLVGALTIGLILALLALGVFISFRIFAFPDITADGSITLGACVTATLIVQRHMEPALATLAGF